MAVCGVDVAAILLIVPVSRNVRIGLTSVSGIPLAVMLWLFLRDEAPLGITAPFELPPIVVMVFAASGPAPRVTSRKNRGRR